MAVIVSTVNVRSKKRDRQDGGGDFVILTLLKIRNTKKKYIRKDKMVFLYGLENGRYKFFKP